MQMKEASLVDMPTGLPLRIRRIRSAPELSNRLRELGFCEDMVVTLAFHRQSHVICDVLNSRVGLSASVAKDIMVCICDQ